MITKNRFPRVVLASGGVAAVAALVLAACSSDEGGGGKKDTDGGNTTGSGGSAAAGSGGSQSSDAGGAKNPGGGTSSSGGDSTGSGGTNGDGGSTPGSGGTSPGAGGAAGGGDGSGGSGAGGEGTGGAPPTGTCKAPTPSQNPGNTCHNAAPPALKLTEIQRNFTKPVVLTFAPGDTSRIYVVQVNGHVSIINDGTLEPNDFLNVQSVIRVGGPAGEQGLLGLAFHPNFEQNGRFFINYNKNVGNGSNTLAEYHVTTGQAPKLVKEYFSEAHPSSFGNHNGGMIAFGPDGCLYTSLGDGGDGNDPRGAGQDLSEPFGSILRFDVDAPATPAPGNMTGANVDGRTWDYGLRNPWRFSFDRATGDLYIGDVGQDAWEEVDVEPSGTGHVNYGWSVMEATHCRTGSGCDQSGKRLPMAETAHPANKAVIGGFVYRGSKIPGMVGRYVYGDHISRKIWTLTYSGENNKQPKICDEAELTSLVPGGDITAFGEDAAGELYVLTLQGIVYRIDPG